MSTLLKTAVALGILMFLVGTAGAVVLDPTVGGSPRGDVGVPGDPSVPGSAGLWFGVVPMEATGGGSGFGDQDHGFFLYEPVVGDGTITALVRNFDTVGGYTGQGRMAGLMMRQSVAEDGGFLDPESTYAANLALPDDLALKPHAQSQYRLPGGDTQIGDKDPGSPGSSPGIGDYLRITRTGNTMEFYWTPNPTTVPWIKYPTDVEVPMFGTVYVGVFVTAGDADEAAKAQFRSVTISDFDSPETIYWDELGSDAWSSESWLDELFNPTTTTPGPTTHAVLRDTNTDKVTLYADGRALSLTVLGGDVEVSDMMTLQVDEQITFDGTLLHMGEDTALRAIGGGEIDEMVGIKGDVIIENWLELQVHNIGAHLFAGGTLTKEGPGKLQLNNSGGGFTVLAPNTTFSVKDGELASAGGDPLGGADQVTLDGGDLSLANGGLISTATAVEVKQDATITTDASGADFSAALGPLTLDDVMLTTAGSGGVDFASTNLPSGATQVTFNTLQDTSSGPINVLDVLDSPTIVKKGGADLVVDEPGLNIDNATFLVDDGTLVGEFSSSPFGTADIELDVGNPADGGLTLRNSGGAAVLSNLLIVNSESTLTADGPDIQLTGDIELWDDLEVRTTGDQLDIAGELKGDDGFRVIEGLVLLSGGGGGDDLRIVGGTLTTSTNKTSFSDDIEARGGTLNIGVEMEVGDRFNLTNDAVVNTSALVNAKRVTVNDDAVLTTAATMVVDNDDLEIDDHGQMTANAQLIVKDDIEVWDDGQLTINAAAEGHQIKLRDRAQVSAGGLVVDDYLFQEPSGQPRTTYDIDTGTFTASGSDMLNAVTLEFGGNKLTVSNSGVTVNPISTAGLLGKWTFDDDTADDSSGNGHDGVLTNGAYSDDVAAALGGRSLDLTSGDSYVVVDTGGTQDVFDGGSNMTVSAWMKGWPDGDWEPFISKGGESGQGWQVRRRGGSSDNMTFTTRGMGNDDPNAADTPVGQQRDRWHHVVATFDGSTRKLYINGDLFWETGTSGSINATESKLVFGARDASGWGGGIEAISHVRLDDIYFYDHAITPDEVLSLLTNGLTHMDVSSTNLIVTDNATLEVEALSSAFGDLDLGGADLAVSGSQDGISFASLNGEGEVSGVMDVTAGGLGPGSSVGVLDVVGNLTLADDAVYTWEWDGTNGDLVNVNEISPGVGGDLAADGDWTLNIIPPSGQNMPGGEYPIFTYDGKFKLPLLPDFLINGSTPPGGWGDWLSLEVDTNGNVLLDVVPEPSSLVLLLTAGLLGFFGLGRRRRRA